MGDKRFLLFSSYLLCTSNRGTSKPKWERGRASGPSLAARGAVCLRVGSLLLQHRHFLHGDCGLFGIRYALDLNVVSLVIGDGRRVRNGQNLFVILRDEDQFCAFGNMLFVRTHLVAVGSAIG